MVKLSTFYVSLALGIMIYTGSIQAKPHESSAHSLEEAIPFQCLLNIPMGISPAEVNKHFAMCRQVRFIDYEGKQTDAALNIPEDYSKRVIFSEGGNTYIENQDTIVAISFSFMNNMLYSVECRTKFSKKLSSRIASEYDKFFGKRKVIKSMVGWLGSGEAFPIDSYIWESNGKTIQFDTPVEGLEVGLSMIDKKIKKEADEFSETRVEVEVFTYNGYDKKKKLNKREWYSENPEQIEGLTTQCEGIGKIALKGKGKGLTFRIQCENGNTVFEKKDINIGSKSNTVLTYFPENCEDKVMRKEVDQDIYGALFYLIVLKNEHEIYKGEITRLDCME